MNTIADTLVAADLAESRGDFARLSEDQTATVERGLAKLHAGDATGAVAVAAILDRRVRMPIYRWDGAVHAFELLARKAERRDLPVPMIEEISRDTIGEGEHAEEWVSARILGAAPVLDGWRCVATFTAPVPVHREGGETEPSRSGRWFVRTGPDNEWIRASVYLDDDGRLAFDGRGSLDWCSGETRFGLFQWGGSAEPNVHVADGETFDSAPAMRCDHCGYSRNRNLVFVLRHEDGRELYVGSTCLNEFLGSDALGAWFVWSRLHEIADGLRGLARVSQRASAPGRRRDPGVRVDRGPERVPGRCPDLPV